MKELLERVAKAMPEGWSLHNIGAMNMDNYDWMLEHEGPDFIHHIGLFTGEGDVGLAPLTALLKQEIRKTHSMSMGWTGGGCELMLWRSLKESDYHVGWEPGESTDFEAVAHAYLAITEAQ